ncbi:hypothetical protein FYJ37_01030 [[Clostridium] scindens]|uniref:Uncharacterized protein n=1 Tax=Clostridium scindens (strain JCM 10418 / VPI 12708) TaxID=29347 RepID=A0A844F786_CLOSV|nr:hypothetical protein [[Clostridium] scindens]MSS38967.1 hypothetical protein [[Clostridium] scindens]
MGSAQAKQLAHELTIEYIKANPSYLQDVRDNIPQMVDKIADVNKRFYDAIIHHEVLTTLY